MSSNAAGPARVYLERDLLSAVATTKKARRPPGC